jgi:hypothetical protein
MLTLATLETMLSAQNSHLQAVQAHQARGRSMPCAAGRCGSWHVKRAEYSLYGPNVALLCESRCKPSTHMCCAEQAWTKYTTTSSTSTDVAYRVLLVQ